VAPVCAVLPLSPPSSQSHNTLPWRPKHHFFYNLNHVVRVIGLQAETAARKLAEESEKRALKAAKKQVRLLVYMCCCVHVHMCTLLM
jgi:hypothetical protein